MPRLPFRRARVYIHVGGFTLIELVLVMVVLGIVGAIVAVFMKSPVEAYRVTLSRAELTDAADTAARRLARDIRTALPNSLRIPEDNCLELIPTKTGGRYRTQPDALGQGSFLDFTVLTTQFDVLSSNQQWPVDQQIKPGDVIAVYNLGIAEADAYQEDNTSEVLAVSENSALPDETKITIRPKMFPLASAGNRFQVIPAEEKIVSYVCTAGDLHRTVSLAFSSNCPATGPVVAHRVSACHFDYSGPDLQRNALVRVALELTDRAQTVRLLHEVHVSNTP